MSRGFVLPSQISPPIAAAAGVVTAQGSSSFGTSQSTTSTSFVGLTTAQTVTLTTGTAALVSISCFGVNTVGGSENIFMSFAVSGATTIAAYTTAATAAGAAGFNQSMSALVPVVLNAGVNTFTAQFRVSAGTGSFASRNIVVLAVS